VSEAAVEHYLKRWDSSLAAGPKSFSDISSRRMFLKQMLSLSAVGVFSGVVQANTNNLESPQWKILSAVHLHMLPSSPDEPDAVSVNATAFLKSVLEWPGVDENDKKFIIDGTGWLNGVASKQYQKDFVLLDTGQKETILRLVEQSKAGGNWLSLILLYLMEALLTDPVYGGNTNAQGWKWLGHQPGFPQPPANKRYFLL